MKEITLPINLFDVNRIEAATLARKGVLQEQIQAKEKELQQALAPLQAELRDAEQELSQIQDEAMRRRQKILSTALAENPALLEALTPHHQSAACQNGPFSRDCTRCVLQELHARSAGPRLFHFTLSHEVQR